MKEKLEELKNKIAQGNTTARDIDTINEIIKEAAGKDEVLSKLSRELNESAGEMLAQEGCAASVNIGEVYITVNIFNGKSNEDDAEEEL